MSCVCRVSVPAHAHVHAHRCTHLLAEDVRSSRGSACASWRKYHLGHLFLFRCSSPWPPARPPPPPVRCGTGRRQGLVTSACRGRRPLARRSVVGFVVGESEFKVSRKWRRVGGVGSPKIPPWQDGSVGPLLANATAKENSSVDCTPDFEPPSEKPRVGSDFSTLRRRFWKVAAPYWSSEDKVQARWRLAGVLALTLCTTGISVGFNFLGRDFYNALASKDQEQFLKQLLYYLGAFVGGIPVFVIRDYSRDRLSLRWRAWMTKYYMDSYFKNQTFYNIQSQSLVDNPDQRIVDDVNSFTTTSLIFFLALFNSTIDLISFSGILYGIYPPLFGVLVVYSIGGTALSVALGKGLVGLNFMQEKREADFRYGLVRVRENAESIAFYGGEGSEVQLLLERFKQSFSNYSQLLVASRNLDFFTSAYRYLIQLLPAAVVAPLFFAGTIEFGVINQSFSAFNHILSDFSIIVYQFQSISAFSAVVDRLGEFNEMLEQQNGFYLPAAGSADTVPPSESLEENEIESKRPRISIKNVKESGTLVSTGGRSQKGGQASVITLLEIEHLTLQTPQYTLTLVEDLSLVVKKGEHLLIMGASGSGKTSLLRAIAGLWTAGKGTITRHIIGSEGRKEQEEKEESNGAAVGTTPAAKAPPEKETENDQYEWRSGGEGSSSNGGFEVASPELRVPSSGQVKVDGNEASTTPPSTTAETQEEATTDLESVSETSVSEYAESRRIFFLPQRPYMVLGSLRQQILYPTWTEQYVDILDGSEATSTSTSTSDDSSPFVFGLAEGAATSAGAGSTASAGLGHQRPQPSDDELIDVLERVSLGHLMEGCDGLDASVEWASVLSLGEQQRLAFARLLVSKPTLALLDESTSALDEDNENRLYGEIEKAGITYVSVGHRSTLQQFHKNILRFRASGAGAGAGSYGDRRAGGPGWSFGPLSALQSSPPPATSAAAADTAAEIMGSPS